MATRIRNTQPELATLVAAHNANVARVGAGSSFHLDTSEASVTAANASSLQTSLDLVNNLLGVYAFHMADTLAHKVAGVALASYAPATDLTSAIARANDIKAKYNTHIASTTHHYNADATNATAASNATDQASLNTLLNELKSDINAHIAGAPSPAHATLRLVGA